MRFVITSERFKKLFPVSHINPSLCRRMQSLFELLGIMSNSFFKYDIFFSLIYPKKQISSETLYECANLQKHFNFHNFSLDLARVQQSVRSKQSNWAEGTTPPGKCSTVFTKGLQSHIDPFNAYNQKAQRRLIRGTIKIIFNFSLAKH